MPLDKYRQSAMSDVFDMVDEHRSRFRDSRTAKAMPFGQLRDVQDGLFAAVRESYPDGIGFDDVVEQQARKIHDALQPKRLTDASAPSNFYNEATGQGTDFDPGNYNESSTPILLSPSEATNIYSSGGVSASIIDKKSKGLFTNGFGFEGVDWNADDLSELEEHAKSLGFDLAVTDAVRDSLIYGGALLVPALRRESVVSYRQSLSQLKRAGVLQKNCVSRFWSADRWNTTLVPNYNLSADDYLHPDKMFVPITGLTVDTSRAAIIKTKKLPYWGTIYQIGWGASDIVSWLRSVLAYEICISAVPIMAQQMSLLFRLVPTEAMLIESGAIATKRFAEETATQLAQASNISPKTISTIGEIQVIDRNFSGFEPLINLLKKDIGAKCRIDESVLFANDMRGFSDGSTNVTYKQAETIQEIGNELVPQLKNVVEILVYSCFGPDSPQAKMAKSLRVRFGSPTVVTNADRVAALSAAGAFLSSWTSGGGNFSDALKVIRTSTPAVDIPDEVIEAADIGQIDENDETSNGGIADFFRSLKNG